MQVCNHKNVSLATSSDWESVCADCGEVMNKFSGFSLAEIEVMMDMACGRVEDMDCEEMEVPQVLRALAEDLEVEHQRRTLNAEVA